jgi:hypothetical protein
VSARRDRDGGAYTIFAAEPRSYWPDQGPRVHMPSKRLTRRVTFWSAAVIPLLLIVFLGCYLGRAAPVVANALTGSMAAPVAVFAHRAVTLIYFLPLAFRGASPSPIFASLVMYLIAGFALLGWRKWRQAVIVLLVPLLCTIPLSVVGLRTADGQAGEVRDTFSLAMTARWSQDGVYLAATEQPGTIRDARDSVPKIDYRFVVFDSSGSEVTVAGVVTVVRTWEGKTPEGTWKEYRHEFKDDYAAEMARQSSGQWLVASLKKDFHPGYEP